MGVAGAAMATFLAILIGVVWMALYFLPAERVPQVPSPRLAARASTSGQAC